MAARIHQIPLALSHHLQLRIREAPSLKGL
jgi:hypothetical protein